MLKLTEELRNQITNYLSNLVVPAKVGADITQIVNALNGLEKIKQPQEEISKDEVKE